MLALLGQTVLVGDWLFGVISLFVFGIGMSLPLLPIAATEGTNRWLVAANRRYKTLLYVGAGSLLILFGAAELSRRSWRSQGDGSSILPSCSCLLRPDRHTGS